jgi:hypothetical protein
MQPIANDDASNLICHTSAGVSARCRAGACLGVGAGWRHDARPVHPTSRASDPNHPRGRPVTRGQSVARRPSPVARRTRKHLPQPTSRSRAAVAFGQPVSAFARKPHVAESIGGRDRPPTARRAGAAAARDAMQSTGSHVHENSLPPCRPRVDACVETPTRCCAETRTPPPRVWGGMALGRVLRSRSRWRCRPPHASQSPLQNPHEKRSR